MKYNWSIPQGWHHMDFYSWFFHRFFEEPNHLRSNKIRFYSVLLQITWIYRIHGLMSANDGAKCWNKTMLFIRKKTRFLHQNRKPNASARKSWVFSTLDIQGSWNRPTWLNYVMGNSQSLLSFIWSYIMRTMDRKNRLLVYRWTGCFLKITEWGARLQENYRSF